MAANVRSAVAFWKGFDLPRFQKALDVTATDLANRQDESDRSRKQLLDLSRDFKRKTPEDIRKAVVPLLKSFQAEIDSLSRRSKAAEAAFLAVYRSLIELPDPVPALELSHTLHQRTMRAQEIDKENRHLREALADCNHDCKGKEVTIKLLRRKVKDYERKSELPEDHNKLNEDETEIKRLNEIKEEEQELEEDSTLELDTKLDEAEKKVAYLQSALESTESELYDLKSKYDDDSQTKSEEMEIVVNDLDRANQRAALAETEVRHLKEQLVAAKQSLQLADQIQKAPDMERAVDVVARSSLELELAAKQKEISQLLDDIQRLQSTLNTLKESSASKIAQLEELVNEKDRMIVELGEKLVKQQDYDDLKKELRYLKSVDFNNQKYRDDDVMKEGRKSLTPAATSENPFKVAKSENTGITTNCSSGMDVFGLTIGQDLVSTFPVTKEEKTSRPSTPLARLELDRKPSPSLDQTNCTLPATLPATNSSPEPSPTAKDMIISDTDKSSLEKLQEMMRHNIDKYANDTLNTLNISRCVRELLSVHNIGQRLFAKFVLGLSQGTVSELLSKPKPWDKLTEKGRDSYRKMHAWASDDHCIFMLKSLVPRRGKESGCGGPQTFKQDDQGAEERIVQILNEAQMAMMNAKQQQQQQQDHQRSPTLPNGSVHLSSTITDSRSMDSCEETRGENGDHKSSSNHSQSGNNLSGHNSSRRSRKYENDDIPQEMVARIYQEELAKLVGQRVEEGFRNPPDQYERTQEEIRQALTIYHQELTRLSHLMPHQNHHHPNSFNPFVANGNTFAAALGQHHSIATTNGGSHHHHLPPQECPMDATVRSRTDSKTSSSRDEPELRHHGSAFSLVRPKTEPNTTSSNTITSSAGNTTAGITHKSSSSSSGGMNAYRLHNSSPAPPPLLPLSEATNPGSGPPSSGNTNGGGSNGGGTEDLSTSASPLQRMQSITNSLLSQTSVPSMPNPPQRPSKAVLPPITQQQFDQYNNLNTEDIVKKVKEQLSQYSISQRLFGESVLGLSQGSVSDLLARPKPWHMLTQKGREPFIRMKIFLEDDNAVHKLVASQYKIAPEKLMRTGGFSGASNPPGLPQFGTNKINSRPPDNHRITESRQTPVNNILYSPQNHQPRATCITPDTLPMSLTMNNTNPAISSSLVSRKQSSSSKGYSQPSVYEMAALTTDLDTQTITSKIKESLMAHNIGQKIFGEVVLGLSQGSVSELLSKPKPWHMLSIKGREPFIRMQMWLNDPHNIEMLQTIKNERREANKRRRTGEGPMDSPVSHSDNPLYGGYNFAPPSPYPPAKKPRVLFTEEQKEALRLAFTLDPYPSTATIEFLATELNLSVRTITNWFHNHRMRMKQHGVVSPAGDEDSRKSSSEISSSSPGALVPVREGLAFDPIHYRVLLNQRLAEKFREKGGNNIGPPFLGNFGGSLPFLYSPYRNCSPLSSSGDDMGTLDLSMSSHMRHSVMASGASSKMNDNGGGSSTDDRSNSEMNDDSNLSQDQPVTEGSDRDSPDDRVRPPTDLSNCRASPLRISLQRQQPPDQQQQPPGQQQQQQARVPTTNSGNSSNRRKPAMPQWVDPGLELSPDSDVHTDDEEDDDEDDEDNERIINGVCVRQAGNFNLLLPREETVHIVPVPAPDAMDASTHNINRHPKNSFKPQLQTSSTVSPPLASRTDDVSSRELSDNEPTVDEDEDDILNGCSKDDGEDPTKKDRCEDLAKKVFSDDGDDDSWDDAAEAKDRRKNIEKLQQRLEKEDAGDDWEF